MDISRRADSTIFGFDFQINAAIILMLDNIKDLKSICLEGNYEDIEILLDSGQYILAQAKAVQHSSSDFKNTRRNLKKALNSLSNAAEQKPTAKLIYITNSPNPLNDEDSKSVFYGNANRSFESLPPSAKNIINQMLDKINCALDPKNLSIRVFPFETDNDDERYKVVLEQVNYFIEDLSLYRPGIGKKLMNAWQTSVFRNSSKENASIVLKKEDIIWPVIVIITDIEHVSNEIMDRFEPGLYDEIVSKYHNLIDSCCERCDFFIKVLSDYNDFNDIGHNSSEKCMDFACTCWQNYKEELMLEGVDEEIQCDLIQIILYTIVRNRIEIDKIKRGVNLC